MKTAAVLAILAAALPERHAGDLKSWQGGPASAILADETCERQGCDSSGIGMLQTTMLRMQAATELAPEVASSANRAISNSSNSSEIPEHDEITDNAIDSIDDLWSSGVAEEEEENTSQIDTNRTSLVNMSNATLEKVKNVSSKISSAVKAVARNATNKSNEISAVNETQATKSNESSTDNETQATVHVTIDIAETVNSPHDNRSLVAAGVELARSRTELQIEEANRTLNKTLAEKAKNASFRLRALVWDAVNASKGSLDGVIERVASVNCSLNCFTPDILTLTNISIQKVLTNTTKRFKDGTCVMAVGNKEANRQTQEAFTAEFVAIAKRADENLSVMFEKARENIHLTMLSIVDEAFVGPNSTIYRSVAESRAAAQGSKSKSDDDEEALLRATMYKAVGDVNSSVASDLAGVQEKTMDDIDKGVQEALDLANGTMFNATDITKEFVAAVENCTKLSPLEDLKLRMGAAHRDLASAVRLMHKLENASEAVKTAQSNIALAKTREDQASAEAAFYTNLSINRSHEAAEELSNMNVSSTGALLISNKVKVLMDEAQNASNLAGLRAAERAEQHILYEASIRDSMLKAKEEAVWADALNLSLQMLTNETSKGVQDIANEMNDTISTFEHYNISVADKLGENVADKYLRNPAALFEVNVGEGTVKSMLETRSQESTTMRVPKPGNVSVHLEINGGNETAINAIVAETERSLKDLLGAEAGVRVENTWQANKTGGDLAVQALVPDVDAGTVELIANTTAQAIQRALGDVSVDEGQVAIETFDNSSNLVSTKVIATGADSDRIVSKAGAAGEKVFGPAAPESTGGGAGFPSSVALYGLITLVALGSVLMCCMARKAR